MKRILVTGATGYVGGRLVPILLERGYQVRVLVRHDSSRLHGRSWTNHVEIVEGDLLKPETLPAVVHEIDAAYYLVHSMSSAAFEERDQQAAKNFGRAARKAGIQRIIYLGGLGDPNSDLSDHLASRQKTGRILRSSGVPTTEFRAAVIVGSGSASFEIIRYLTERLPVMICPRWVYTRTQPIAVQDVLRYLARALEIPESTGEIIDIGGRDILTYGDMILGYAAVRGLKRVLIPIPLLTPTLSSYWVHLVTPLPASIAGPLIRGLRNEAIVQNDNADALFPSIEPIGYREAVHQALRNIQEGNVETIWTDALSSSQQDEQPAVLSEKEGVIRERYETTVSAPPSVVYRTFTSLGDQRGWLSANWLWRIRGLIDRMLGGVGYQRRRRDPDDIRAGDALDFWRVETVTPGNLIRLRAEMKLPGEGWLQFEAREQGPAETRLIQTAYFAPRGLTGLLYWYGLYPIHAVIFQNMVREIAQEAQNRYDAQQTKILGKHPSSPL